MPDRVSLDRAEWFLGQIDQADGINIAVAAPHVGYRRQRAIVVDVEGIGADPGRQRPIVHRDRGAVDMQHTRQIFSITGQQSGLAVGQKRDRARHRFRVAEIELAGRFKLLVLHGKDREGALAAVGDESERTIGRDRHPVGTLPRIHLLNDLRRRGFEVDHRHAIVGHDPVGALRLDFSGCGDEHKALVGGNPDRRRRADDAGRRLDGCHHLWWILADIDDRHGIRRGVLRRTHDTIDIRAVGIVCRDREVGQRRQRRSDERDGKRADRDPNVRANRYSPPWQPRPTVLLPLGQCSQCEGAERGRSEIAAVADISP